MTARKQNTEEKEFTTEELDNIVVEQQKPDIATMGDYHLSCLNSVKATNDILAEGGNQFIADNARRENIIVEALLFMFNNAKAGMPVNTPVEE